MKNLLAILLVMISGQSLAQLLDVCVPADSIGCLREDSLDVALELEPGGGLMFGSSSFTLLSRLGLGPYHTGLTIGGDVRFNKGNFDSENIGVYLKFARHLPIELSGHYMLSTLRGLENSGGESIEGFGVGFGVGMDVYVFNIRTDLTFYEFLEEAEDGKTLPIKSGHVPGGLSVSMILTIPLRMSVDLI